MRRFMLLVAIVSLTSLSGHARAQFCPGVSPWVFDDVAASDPFCGYITWMAQNGITLGCQVIDANHRLYCPNANVTRASMAAFMNRLNTQPDSTSIGVGTIAKPGGSFLHNFGANNTFLGVNAGNFTMTGTDNTAVGNVALGSNAFGTGNTAVGSGALPVNTEGGANTAIGTAALNANLVGGTNTAVGRAALAQNVFGSGNTAVGRNALQQSTGFGNVALGNAAGSALTSGDNNVYIANPGAASEGLTMRIGAFPFQTRAFVAGIRGITTGNNDAVAVVIDSAGQLGTLSSSRKAKEDIADMGDASDVLMKLHPVSFRYKLHEGKGRVQYGLIAEEVMPVAPQLVAAGRDGEVETVYYQDLPPMLVNEYQKQQRTIEAQAREIAAARVEIAELKRAVELLLARTSPEGRIASR